MLQNQQPQISLPDTLNELMGEVVSVIARMNSLYQTILPQAVKDQERIGEMEKRITELEAENAGLKDVPPVMEKIREDEG